MQSYGKKFLAPMVMLHQNYRPLKTRCYNRKCHSTLIIDRLNNSAYDVENFKRKQNKILKIMSTHRSEKHFEIHTGSV